MANSMGWVSDLLAAVQSAQPVKSVAVLARVLQEQFAAEEVSFLITDRGGDAVVRLTGSTEQGGTVAPEPLALSGTAYERVIHSQQLWVSTEGHAGVDTGRRSTRVVAPVTDRGDAIGVLELTLPVPPDVETLERITEASRVLAYVVVADRRFTDLYEWGRRTTRLSLAAEIQHRLLPESFTCDAGPFIIAGSLEPATDVGGDTFDYTLNGHGLNMSLTDAMGHDVRAALLATVIVGALRNARRAGAGLAGQAEAANKAVLEHAVSEHRAVLDQSAQVTHALAEHGAQAMATGQLLRVAFETRRAEFINAGHVWPLLLRDGQVEEITPGVDLPFGISPHAEYHVQSLDLRPGDRLFLLTDGMIEPHGHERELRRLIKETGTLHAREASRALTQAVMRASDHDPRDDATVLCLDWGGPDWPHYGTSPPSP
ncbi:PP2C family protein-serine/threonine phosphatase [Streptomyces sp. RK75]|uniref:PP2C family protein-serine/threonine phosphatase n=1 Tax=Streptomyces sp. RK75 TaxID=2824895 RepID=UPI000C6BAED3|nr:PP2C family protein-serine/threonine phosphatase [Streptomyces sp. RK75]